MTEPRFLLDTNILIYLVEGTSETLREKVEEHPPGALVTSTLCAAEALFGLAGDPLAEAAFQRLMAVVEPKPFERPAAEAFPRIPFSRGRLDRLIAAHTLSLGLTLVTNNESDFADVAALQVENWTRR